MVVCLQQTTLTRATTLSVQCPHKHHITPMVMSCELLKKHGVEHIAGQDNPNYLCDTCKSQWNGGPPADLTPVLVEIAHPNIHAVEQVIVPRGLGDTIAKFTHATGIDKVAEFYTRVTGKDCGCKGRQEALNKLVPYSKDGIVDDGNR